MIPVGEQAEWFLLAISSYKLKKYGECLFAVSKTTRRHTDVVDDQASCGQSFTSRTQESVGPAQDPDSNFDEAGNLNTRGKIFCNYLKAKCLCKLKRYSESLFALARITSNDQFRTELSERQYFKVILYKGINLFHVKQYMNAVLTLNQLLQHLQMQQKDLLEGSPVKSVFSEESLKLRIEQKKTMAKILIQAYSHRGKANQELNDFENAIIDYNRLLELSQFQDVPTKQICEYMSQIAQLKTCVKKGGSLQKRESMPHSSSKNDSDSSPPQLPKSM